MAGRQGTMDMETVLSQIREKLAATRHHGGEIEIKVKIDLRGLGTCEPLTQPKPAKSPKSPKSPKPEKSRKERKSEDMTIDMSRSIRSSRGKKSRKEKEKPKSEDPTIDMSRSIRSSRSKRSKRDKSGKKRSRSQLNKKKERERESLKQLAKETGDDDVEWGKAANSDSQVTIYENAVILNTDPLPPPPPDASTIAPHLLARSEDETSSHGTSSRNSRAASNRNSRRDATASPDKHPCTKRNCHCKSSNRRCMKRK